MKGKNPEDVLHGDLIAYMRSLGEKQRNYHGEKWHGAEAKEIEALEWLADRGATDKDKSEVMIKEFEAQIARVFEIEDESARRHYSKLKKRGLIDSKRAGKDSSRVWITFDPVNATDVEPLPLSDTAYWKITQDGYPTAHLHTCTLVPLLRLITVLVIYKCAMHLLKDVLTIYKCANQNQQRADK